jgi:hypothetical protein
MIGNAYSNGPNQVATGQPAAKKRRRTSGSTSEQAATEEEQEMEQDGEEEEDEAVESAENSTDGESRKTAQAHAHAGLFGRSRVDRQRGTTCAPTRAGC